MRMLPLLLMIFILNGCDEPEPCVPQPCIQNYPTLPTYRTPESRHLSVKPFNPEYSIIKNDDLLELVQNNGKLRRICGKYAAVAVRVNEKYEEEK